MKIIVMILLLLVSLNLRAEYIPGMTINIYKKISGIWDSPRNNLEYIPDDNFINEFGWGVAKINLNGFTIIDPVDNEIQFAGLHTLKIKSFNQISDNEFLMEIYFLQGNIQRYKINVIRDNLLYIVDSGSTAKYLSLEKNYKRLVIPDFKSNKSGHITGKSVRVRSKPDKSSNIFGLIPENDQIVIIKQSDKKEKIDGDEYYWFKIVSDSGYSGWVFGKYVKFDK